MEKEHAILADREIEIGGVCPTKHNELPPFVLLHSDQELSLLLAQLIHTAKIDDFERWRLRLVHDRIR